MLYAKDNNFNQTQSVHSLGLANNLTIPNPGWDQNTLLLSDKSFVGRANQMGPGDAGFVNLNVVGAQGSLNNAIGKIAKGLGCAGNDLMTVAILGIVAIALCR